MAMWNPWRGCHKHSEGCKYCYIHKGNAKKGLDTNKISMINFNLAITDMISYFTVTLLNKKRIS